MDDNPLSLDCLPFEILQQIFDSEELSYVDLCRLSEVCKTFNCVVEINKLWEHKYRKNCPEIADLYDGQVVNWRSELKFKCQCAAAISKALLDMSEELYHLDKVSHDSFLRFNNLCGEHPMTDFIVTTELERIIRKPPTSTNLTKKYYAKKAFRYILHKTLANYWQVHLSNGKGFTLLKGASLISRWCQPFEFISGYKVYTHINVKIKQVSQYLTRHNPAHPVLKWKIPQVKFENDRVLMIQETIWSRDLCQEILHAINEILYTYLGFSGNEDDYYSPQNNFIDQVLATKKGIPITLSIIYQSIAAMFGVALLPVNFPGHVLLKWKEYPYLPGVHAYTFIDAYDEGRQMNADELPELIPGFEQIADGWFEENVQPFEIFTRMLRNLVEGGQQHDDGRGIMYMCDALELLLVLNPNDNEHKLLLARVYMHLSINLTQVISLLQDITYQDPAYVGAISIIYRTAIIQLETQRLKNLNVQKQCKRRCEESSNVAFAIGMIMKHKKYSYRCVIYDWDPTCHASADWIRQMGVMDLKCQDRQPFYHVLVDDGTNRYAAQENLEVHEESNIVTHDKVGHYFDSFHGQYYLPNKQKLLEYPDDVAYREEVYPKKMCL